MEKLKIKSFNLVIFGGDGDLSKRKILPALYQRYVDGQLNASFKIICIRRKESALNFFDENIPVLVFSDDIDWAYSQDIFQEKRFYFSRNSSNAMDLCMQTFCTYHIIANSSFSWWGAWLSNSKKVIKPRKWFDPPLPTDHTFLNVDGWTSLSVNT